MGSQFFPNRNKNPSPLRLFRDFSHYPLPLKAAPSQNLNILVTQKTVPKRICISCASLRLTPQILPRLSNNVSVL